MDTDTNLNAKVYYHKLGTSQSDDALVWEDVKNPGHRAGISQTECSRYIVLSISASAAPRNKVWIAPTPESGDLSAKSLKWTKIEDRIDHAGYFFITNEKSVFYFETNMNAPQGRIVKYDLNHPGFVEVIAQDKSPLTSVHAVDFDKAILVYSVDVNDVMFVYNLFTGERLKQIDVPVGTSLTGVSCNRRSSEVIFSYAGFIMPDTVRKFDVGVYNVSVVKQQTIPGYDPNQYQSDQVFYLSKDGTRIPMYILHRKGIVFDGSHPTHLYGYGGFALSMTPFFSLGCVAFMKHFGGIVAVPGIRGGGEYGGDWHMAGALTNKQNVFDDFQWAAKYLIRRGYTTNSKLAISGISNGGLLVAACINQSPELFGAAVVQVGVLDMLRFHKFTIGHAWCSDYGDPGVKQDFEYLLTYSPLHNVRKQTYPSTLLMTSDHDDRVVPLHSYKYIAELQYRNPSNANPLFMYTERDAGHGSGTPNSKEIELAALKHAFIAMNTGAVWRD